MCHKEINIEIVHVDGRFALMTSSNAVTQTPHVLERMSMQGVDILLNAPETTSPDRLASHQYVLVGVYLPEVNHGILVGPRGDIPVQRVQLPKEPGYSFAGSCALWLWKSSSLVDPMRKRVFE
ncbi:hypothetical protein GB937_001303 [Aspergillus fischeri]|nr:hypothetical protein GB937_001303 [Aspergillus fischeri]